MVSLRYFTFVKWLILSGDYQTSASLSGVDLCQNSRRLSTRSIKRKKFDDELVESSLIKSERARPPRQQSASETRLLLPGQSSSVTSAVTEHIDMPTPPAAVDRKKVHKVILCSDPVSSEFFGDLQLPQTFQD